MTRFPVNLLVVGLLGAPVLAVQQADLAWERTFFSGTGDDAFPTGLTVLPDNGLVVAWATSPPNGAPGQHGAWLARYDREGGELWRLSWPNLYGHSGGFRDIVPSADGGTFSILFDRVHKRDAAGTLAWRRPAGRVVALPDGGCAVTVITGALSSTVTRYGPSGDVVWTHPLQGEPFTLEADELGNVFVVGYNDFFHTNEPLPVLAARVSFDGQLAGTTCNQAHCINDPAPRWFGDESAWNYTYAVGMGAWVDKRGHVAMLLGGAFGQYWQIHSFDRIGARTWSLTGPTPAWNAYPQRVAVEDTGHVWAAGESGPNIDAIGAMRVDPLGNILWAFDVPLPAGSAIRAVEDVQLDPAGGAYVYGFVQTPGDGAPYVLALDAAGGASLNVLPTLPVGRPYEAWQRMHLVVDSDRRVTQFQPVMVGGVLGARLSSWVRGGAHGVAVCGPAVPNSTGQPATLTALGSEAVLENRLTLVAGSLPSASLTMFLTGTAHQPVTPVPGSQGTLCVSGDIGRFLGPGEPRFADASGRASVQLDLARLPSSALGTVAVQAGETRVFQAWYRDANPNVTSNFSAAVAVTLQ